MVDFTWVAWNDLPWYKKLIVVLVLLCKALAWKIKQNWKGKYMEKPFDIKELGARIKAKSLDVKGVALDLAEDELKVIAEETLGWVQDSVIATENRVDDLAVPVLGILKPLIMKEIDKVDGKVG